MTTQGNVPEEQTETIPQGMQCNFCDPIAFVDDADRHEYIMYGTLGFGKWESENPRRLVLVEFLHMKGRPK